MLRSTGFFRAIDCPYWAGAPGGPCRRPYCHFRHRGARGPGAPGGGGGGGGGAAPSAAGLCYDPYNPELPKPAAQRENGALGPGDMLELELVNQAIEAVRSEVEQEQRRYQELLDTAREQGTDTPTLVAHRTPDPTATAATDPFPLAFDYKPSHCSTGTSDGGYQPTPLVPPEATNKYLLEPKGSGGALEYIPKAVSQPRRPRSVPSGKYVLDDSRPSTDLEYDPLSNFSARLLSRANARDEQVARRPRGSRASEPYTPAPKKICDPFAGCDARFSDSEDEEAAAPATSTSPPSARAATESKAPQKPGSKEGQEPNEGGLRVTKETAVQCDGGDLGQSPAAKPDAPALASQERCDSQGGRPKKKKSHQDKNGVPKKDRAKGIEPTGRSEKVRMDKKDVAAGGPRAQTGIKKKPASTTAAAGATSSGKARGEKPQPSPTNGRPPHTPQEGPGARAWVGKLAKRKARSLDEGTSRGGPKLKRRALSHADLFGDESDDEDPPGRISRPPALPSLSSSSDSDSDSSSGLSAERVPAKKLKVSPPPSASLASPPSSSSSSSPGAGTALEQEVDFDSDPMEECLRIFRESTSVKTQDRGRLARQPPKEEKTEDKGQSGLTTLFPGQKRRVSHLAKQGKEAESTRRISAPPVRLPSAQEVCYRRAQQAQRDSAGWLLAAQKPSSSSSSSYSTSSVHISAPGEKRRIAHVPNPRLAAAPTGAKRTLTAGSSQPTNGPEPGGQALKTRTLSGMASKTTTTVTPKRIAHSPSLQSLKKPIIPKEFGGKVPTVIRQRYLNLFIEECLKFCSSSQEAIEKALNEEKAAFDRSPSKNIYLNVAVNTLKKLRGLVPSSVPGVNKTSGRRLVSHEVVLGGKLAAKTSFSLSRPSSPRVEDLKGIALYSRLKEYLLSEDQLKENGFPFPHPERPGGAVLFTGEEKKPKDSSCRICCRCGAEYMVLPSGRCVRHEECVYHWGRLRRNRVAGGWETQYMCCSGAVGSTGCQVAKQHVQDGRKENLEGFVKTFEKDLGNGVHPGVYALDCEMSYTTYGLELTRVTVVDSDLQVVYDTFVMPDNEIVDYNTRFSGVTEADLADTSTSLRDVQAVLLSMLSADTILIGHSLESDLLALKVIHSTVVDTSVLFPHRLGLPYKRSLRNLMADYLKQIIQDNVDGHSSSEDASACMHLVIWKIREDAKTKR
ncbi:RNA exonuclease 1 homolog [Suncus etruscus]|uniref:RNA exonuclease 1 homolog n=1 Tax=Suncus etruscus TaxID=109475 RepID=UPI00211005FA|nr:RNA exonuclease 1 homolog [Suncus etruscus]